MFYRLTGGNVIWKNITVLLDVLDLENQMEKVDASEEMLLKPTRMNHQAISSCITGDNTDYRDH